MSGSTPFFRPRAGGYGPDALGGAPSVLGPGPSAILKSGTDGFDNALNQNTKAINKALNGALVKALEQDAEQGKKDRILRGMQAAAMGESIQDIETEQPWYSRIFGKNDVTLGAEQYVKATQATRVMQDLSDRMKDLRRADPDTFRQEVARTFENAKTGVPDVDFDVQARLLEKFPELVRQHTKQHYQYKQEAALETQREFFGASLNDLGTVVKAAANDPSSESSRADMAFAIAKYDADTARLDGQEEALWLEQQEKNLSGEIGKAVSPHIVVDADGNQRIQYGSLHAVSAIISGSQNFAKLPQEAKERIMAQYMKASHQLAIQYYEPYTQQLAKAQAEADDPGPFTNVQKLVKEIEDIHKQVQRDVGTIAPLWGTKEKIAQSEATGKAIKRREEQERLRVAAEAAERSSGAAKEYQEQMAVFQLASWMRQDPAGYMQALANGGIQKKLADKAENITYQQQSTPEGKRNVIKSLPWLIEAGKAERTYEADLILNKPLDNLLKSSDQTLALLEDFTKDVEVLGATRAAQYWTPERYKVLKAASEMAKSGKPVDYVTAAMHQAYHNREKPQVSKAAQERAAKLMVEQSNKGMFATLFDWTNSRNPLTGGSLQEGTMQGMAADIAARYQAKRDVLPDAPEAQLMQEAQMEVLTGSEATYAKLGDEFFVKRLYPGQSSPQDYLMNPPNGGFGIPRDAIQETIEDVIRPYVKGDVTGYTLTYGANGNVPRLILFQYTNNGETTHVDIPMSEILQTYHDRKARRKAAPRRAGRADRIQ